MMDADLLWKEGSFLMTIEYYGYRIALYSLGTDYYEVVYNPIDNEIEKIKLAGEEDLSKYLNRIELKSLQGG